MSKKSDKHLKTEKGVDLGRRSVAKAGLAAPVLMTLISKPVLANQCSHSGMMSGNTSNPNDVTCEGCTPGFWKTHPNVWQGYETGTCSNGNGNGNGNGNNGASPCNGGYEDDGTIFKAVFTGCRGIEPEDSQTMMNLLIKVNSYWTLHAHAVAALLNAEVLGVASFGYTPEGIKDLWCGTTGNLALDGLSNEELKNIFAMLNERSCPLPY